MKKLKTLYIFPHPDDESFGPAPVMYRQIQQSQEVYLLTLTKGGATKVRFKYNLSIEEMGQVRVKEMEKVKSILGLTGMEILDIEDGSLAQMNSLDLEKVVSAHIQKIQPDVVVTYAIHGISGHPDHLAIHAAVKRVYCDLLEKKRNGNWRRLALFTFPTPENNEKQGAMVNARTSHSALIDCIVDLSEIEIQKLKDALYCYETFIEVIEQTGVINAIGNKVHFEFYGEDFTPPLKDLTDKLGDNY